MIKKIMNFINKHNITILVISVLLAGIVIGMVISKLSIPKVEVIVPEVETTTAAAPVEETAEPEPEPEITPEAEEKGKALRQAEISMSTGSGMSKAGLYDFLTVSYNYSPEAAEYAVNNLNVDWKEKAYSKLSSYLSLNKDWDYDRAYGQLEYEKFEKEEIEYAIEKAGIKKAE